MPLAPLLTAKQVRQFSRWLPALCLALTASGASAAQPQGAVSMDISRNGTRPSAQGPEDYFTGKVRIDPLFDPQAPARAGAALVTFEPGARSAWHTHPLGQRLIVTSGVGRTQVEGGPVVEIRPGDVVWCPPGIKHWHGASPDVAMSHIAIQEALDGKMVEWMEKVSDEDYAARPQAAPQD